ncbi:MAG TPA: hypothetical protein VIG48_02250 [Jatrophihabitans sp.]
MDRLLAAGGAVVAAVLLIAGVLLTWAHGYVHDQVHGQLAAQKIYFPADGSPSLIALPPADRAAMEQYAGQQLVTGAQARTWADHYIAVHLKDMAGGQTYAQLSAKSLADPKNTQLAGLVQTEFRGETLRGLLLNAYAFDTMGNLALIGAIVAYVGAALMAVLAALGFVHARRVHVPTPPASTPSAGETVNV